MRDRKLTMLGLALLAVTVLLYSMDAETIYIYVVGVAMLAVFVIVLVKLNRGLIDSDKK